ncbi:MAG: Fic family protein [Blastocatellia bacterium]|nr:Fic family protein [Blastocatellia bacterium]
MIKYQIPENWIKYNPLALVNELTDAKAAVISLTTTPYQKVWTDKLQHIQLKREVAGTSRIEGADFTENELEIALRESPEELLTRSQRQAHAAVQTYRWIATLQDDYPIDADLIREVHRKVVTGADDDHCEPGHIRQRDQNVSFGLPPHRGAEGGEECEVAFAEFSQAIRHEFKGHDLLIQALALHYHFAAMHPFLDGNGRTARALEALVLQRAGLRDALFIAMSNYYYDEKTAYLRALSEVRANDHDLTSFLKFGLRGIALQCKRLFGEIRNNVAKALFRNMMHDLFNRLESPRKRVIKTRQIEILKILLETDEMLWEDFRKRTSSLYKSLRRPSNAMIRDLGSLIELGAISWHKDPLRISINLDWPAQITESHFFEVIKRLPKAKPPSFGF